MSNTPVDIIMITFYRKQFTEKSIPAIHERTRFPHNFYVIDNHSQDGTFQFLVKAKKEGMIKDFLALDENIGLEAALNKGLEIFVKSDRFVTTDNDIIP